MTPFTKEQNPNEKSFLAKTVDTAVDAAAHTSKLAVVVPAMFAAQIMEGHNQDSKEAQESTGNPGVVATVKAWFHM